MNYVKHQIVLKDIKKKKKASECVEEKTTFLARKIHYSLQIHCNPSLSMWIRQMANYGGKE